MSTLGVLRAVSRNGHARLNKPIGITGTWKRTQKDKRVDRQTDCRCKINVLKLCNQLRSHTLSDNRYPFVRIVFVMLYF